jgi:hypothetical protein
VSSKSAYLPYALETKLDAAKIVLSRHETQAIQTYVACDIGLKSDAGGGLVHEIRKRGTLVFTWRLLSHEYSQHRSRKAQMNNSVYQARWLLGSVFLLSFGVLAVGFVS